MKLMIIKSWVTLTFYNSILISSCIGGALPYLQQNQQQNQLQSRSPASSYGTPTIQPIIGQIQPQPLLNVATQAPPTYSQQFHQNQLQQQPQRLYQQPNKLLSLPQQQHPQVVRQQQQSPLLLPPPPPPHSSVTVLSNQRQQPIQSQPLSSRSPQETTLIYPTRISAPSENVLNSYQQPQQQHQSSIVQSPMRQVYHSAQIASLPLIAPSSLPPLQPGPVTMRIFTTSENAGNEQNIASNQIIVENYSTQDSDSFLTGAKNSTLYAAQLLAKSLLEASHETDSYNNQQLNKTDLVVVKTQKKAYIIPMHLQGHRLNQTEAQELYENRDKLPVAYTVNQFLFIIKPENVNFLNKLV